jgi:hypothetical protein
MERVKVIIALSVVAIGLGAVSIAQSGPDLALGLGAELPQVQASVVLNYPDVSPGYTPIADPAQSACGGWNGECDRCERKLTPTATVCTKCRSCGTNCGDNVC